MADIFPCFSELFLYLHPFLILVKYGHCIRRESGIREVDRIEGLMLIDHWESRLTTHAVLSHERYLHAKCADHWRQTKRTNDAINSAKPGVQLFRRSIGTVQCNIYNVSSACGPMYRMQSVTVSRRQTDLSS